MIHALKIKVEGKVQGVWFRKGTEIEASSLSLVGTVQNLSDSSVLIKVSGEKANVLKLLEWCKTGTPNAIVDSISYEEIESIDKRSFEILR